MNEADTETADKPSSGTFQDDSTDKKKNDLDILSNEEAENSVEKNSAVKNSVITLREMDFRKLAELKEVNRSFDRNYTFDA